MAFQNVYDLVNHTSRYSISVHPYETVHGLGVDNPPNNA